jgi:hypothetical protein
MEEPKHAIDFVWIEKNQTFAHETSSKISPDNSGDILLNLLLLCHT